MPISCHWRDCKALLVTSLTHVSGAIAKCPDISMILPEDQTKKNYAPFNIPLTLSHCYVLSLTHRDTAVPAEGNGDLQTLICVLVARPRRCPTSLNPVPWQNWMAAYLGYSLRMKTLFRGWPVMLHDTHTRRRRLTHGKNLARSRSPRFSHATDWSHFRFGSTAGEFLPPKGAWTSNFVAMVHKRLIWYFYAGGLVQAIEWRTAQC